MNLEQFGEELKKLRQEKEVSLSDISVETRINQKFLESIESGKFHILPQTYIRAFLKEYASMIGADPDEILEKYDLARQETLTSNIFESNLQSKHKIQKEDQKPFELSSIQRNLIFGSIILLAIVVITILAYTNRNSTSDKPPKEISFDNVIRENEAVSITAPYTITDTQTTPRIQKIDSLYLQINTQDSVWISILIDGKKGESYLLSPNRKKTWVAKEKFSITMGNAGGAFFQLNGKDIGYLGKRGAVIRNAIITEANLNY